MTLHTANIPMRTVGPIKIIGSEVNDEIHVPLATYETPLWPSTNRGAKVSRLSGGISAVVIDDRMTRSILLEAPTAIAALECIQSLQQRMPELQTVAKGTSHYAELIEFHHQITGNLLFLRFAFRCGDASGHNMSTNASQYLVDWILENYPHLEYVSLSGNYCTDKKANAVNGILGRGKNVIAEILIPGHVVETVLHTTPQRIANLNVKKNLIGSINAGGIRTANAHFANVLLALYLATGQDAANIVEGSQGITHAEVRGDDLYFSVTVPNIIVGTVGNGKELDFVQHNLEALGCLAPRASGANARRLAIIVAATILCAELSLMSALTNSHELMRAHIELERKVKLGHEVK
jgi:hydroxymethylglutaryl-CoA reductase (NADPH)